MIRDRVRMRPRTLRDQRSDARRLPLPIASSARRGYINRRGIEVSWRRRGHMRTLRILTFILIVAGLTACSGPSISLSPSETELPACAVRDISVADLGTSPRAVCDLAGSTVVFPDGFRVVVGRVLDFGSKSTGNSDTYSLSNLGVYGVVAMQTTPDGNKTRWWGTVKGVEMQKRALNGRGPVISNGKVDVR